MPIPNSIKLNGTEIAFDDLAPIPLPLPGNWQFRVSTKGALTLWAFRDLDYGDVDVHRFVMNGVRDLKAPTLKLRFDDDGGFPNLMGSTEGYGWTLDEYIAFRTAQAETPFDHVADKLVAEGREDVDVTRYGGSANMEFHHWAGMVGRRYGLSRSIYSLLNANKNKQARRPRWFLAPNGLPAGLDGKDPGQIPHFDEWREDAEGLNAFDAQHLDGTELFWGFRLTGDPSFLIALIQLWLSARWNSYYLRIPKAHWAGSVRTPGWWFILSAFVLDATHGLPGMAGFRGAVISSVRDHLAQLLEHFPIWNWSDKDSQKPWMCGPVILGLKRLALLDGMPVSITNDALTMIERIRAWLDEYAIKDGLIAYRVFKDQTREPEWMTWKHGVQDWHAGAFSVLDDQGLIGSHVIAHLQDAGVGDPKHPYHLSKGVGLMPTLLGYEEWVR